MENINSFFHFAQMRKDGKTDQEILFEMTKDSENDLIQVLEKVKSVIERSIAFRKEDGKDLVEKLDDAPDITLPARRRIKASFSTHNELKSKISEIETLLIEMQKKVDSTNKIKERLTKRLINLTSQLQSSTEEPKWMRPGTLEKLREGGQAFGLACSRR